jgi:hypothetical protein
MVNMYYVNHMEYVSQKKNIWNTFWRTCPATLFIEADLFAEPIVRPSDTCSVNLEEQSSKKQVLMTWN